MPTTWTSLKADILAYQEQKGAAFIAQIPKFIEAAEERLATELKQQGFQVVADFAMPTDGLLEKPAWWRETISMSYKDADDKRHTVFLRSLQYCQNFWPDSSAVGPPRFYADYNAKNFLIVPTPSSAFDAELVYYARLDPLGEENEANWLTQNMPRALFGAAMIEANVFAKNAAGIALWTGYYNEARGSHTNENRKRVVDKSALVTQG